MKHILKLIVSIIVFVVFASTGEAAEEKKPIAGPKGGKLLENAPPRAEFYVEKDHKVAITFYDANLKPTAVGEQTAVVWADAKNGRKKLEFEKRDGALISTTPLPEGEGYNVMVQLKSKPDAKAQNFKISYHTETCGECKLAEYACICPPEKEHAHEHKPGEKEHKH
jgi:hypothetical protein